MKTLALLFSATSVLMLSACDQASVNEKHSEPTVEQQTTVFDSQLEALEKAKLVEAQLKDAETRRKKAMQENGL